MKLMAQLTKHRLQDIKQALEGLGIKQIARGNKRYLKLVYALFICYEGAVSCDLCFVKCSYLLISSKNKNALNFSTNCTEGAKMVSL